MCSRKKSCGICAVGVDGAAMPHRFQRIDRRLDDLAARLAVDRGDEADAAGVMLLGGIVKPLGREMRGIGAVFIDEAHGAFPAELGLPSCVLRDAPSRRSSG
jgi:hypothetical protein